MKLEFTREATIEQNEESLLKLYNDGEVTLEDMEEILKVAEGEEEYEICRAIKNVYDKVKK